MVAGKNEKWEGEVGWDPERLPGGLLCRSARMPPALPALQQVGTVLLPLLTPAILPYIAGFIIVSQTKFWTVLICGVLGAVLLYLNHLWVQVLHLDSRTGAVILTVEVAAYLLFVWRAWFESFLINFIFKLI